MGLSGDRRVVYSQVSYKPCSTKLKKIKCLSGLYQSRAPPKSPLRRGTKELSCPPLLRGLGGSERIVTHTED
jgi:hypothetical protein